MKVTRDATRSPDSGRISTRSDGGSVLVTAPRSVEPPVRDVTVAHTLPLRFLSRYGYVDRRPLGPARRRSEPPSHHRRALGTERRELGRRPDRRRGRVAPAALVAPPAEEVGRGRREETARLDPRRPRLGRQRVTRRGPDALAPGGPLDGDRSHQPLGPVDLEPTDPDPLARPTGDEKAPGPRAKVRDGQVVRGEQRLDVVERRRRLDIDLGLGHGRPSSPATGVASAVGSPTDLFTGRLHRSSCSGPSRRRSSSGAP